MAGDHALIALDDEGHHGKELESNDARSTMTEDEIGLDQDMLNFAIRKSDSPNLAICVICGTAGVPNNPCLHCCMFNKVDGDHLFRRRYFNDESPMI